MIDKSYCFLYKAITVNDKSYLLSLLVCIRKLIYSSVFLVLKEVVLQLYMCPLCENSVFTTANGFIYKFRKKSIHCTGYPLIQVEIVSV